MANIPPHHNEPWTPEDVKRLEELARQNTSADEIAIELGRTQEAVRSKAYKENISLSTAIDQKTTGGAAGYINQVVADIKRCIREQPGSAMLITAAGGLLLGLLLGGRSPKRARKRAARRSTDQAFARIEEAFDKRLKNQREAY